MESTLFWFHGSGYHGRKLQRQRKVFDCWFLVATCQHFFGARMAAVHTSNFTIASIKHFKMNHISWRRWKMSGGSLTLVGLWENLFNSLKIFQCGLTGRPRFPPLAKNAKPITVEAVNEERQQKPRINHIYICFKWIQPLSIKNVFQWPSASSVLSEKSTCLLSVVHLIWHKPRWFIAACW